MSTRQENTTVAALITHSLPHARRLAVSSDEDDVDVGGADGAPAKGMSKTLALRMQKKLMGMTVKSKEAAKNFIDDDMGELSSPSHTRTSASAGLCLC